MSDADTTGKTAAEPSKANGKKGKLVPILLALVIVLLAGGGAGGYWIYTHRSGESSADAPPPPPPKSGVVDMAPFVVNLADEGGTRFLRLNLKLLTWDEDQALELKEDPVTSARIRSALLELLSLQYAAPLTTPEGKAELKLAIAERATEAAGHGGHGEHDLKVTDVLFAEFVVQ